MIKANIITATGKVPCLLERSDFIGRGVHGGKSGLIVRVKGQPYRRLNSDFTTTFDKAICRVE